VAEEAESAKGADGASAIRRAAGIVGSVILLTDP
jgi:hypothetical protein